MTDNKTLLQLECYRSRKKNLVSEFDDDLNQALQRINDEIVRNINNCTDALIILAKNDSPKFESKNVLKRNLKTLRKSDYTTEEKVVIAEYFDDLSGILEINIDVWINAFIYGWVQAIYLSIVNLIVNRKTLQIANHTLCNKCGSDLYSVILEKDYGILDPGFSIVKCKICGEYNLLTLEPGIKRSSVRNYIEVEHLSPKEYNLDQAIIRLEQIKRFRN